MSRLTVVPAIAVDAALACLLWTSIKYAFSNRRVHQRAAALALAALLTQLHLVRAAALSYEGTRSLRTLSNLETNWVESAAYGGRSLRGRHVIVVSAADMATQYSLPYILHSMGADMPASAHTLTPATANTHILIRPAINVLRIEFPDDLIDEPFRRSVYRTDCDFQAGERIPGPVFDVTVDSLRHGQPHRLTMVFQAPLEDPRYLFMYPTEHGLEPLQLPRIGETKRLPPPAWPR
jgi:hypothetical protein